jgi:hypothetical protein
MSGRTGGDSAQLSIAGSVRRALAAAEVDSALIAGGDGRLDLDPRTGLNGYGCQPFPRPQEISFSSSTASTISPQAYAAAEDAFRELSRSGPAHEQERAAARLAAMIRHRLKRLFGLDDGFEVILSPSGTDAVVPALFLAREALAGKPVTSIIVASDETGSGVSLAAAGRHFGSLTGGRCAVGKGEPIRGLGAGACAVGIPVRDRRGDARPIAEIDADVRAAVSNAVAAENGVVLHLMDHSKLGSRFPSQACLDDVCARFPRAIQVVVDGCQTRRERSRWRAYLDRGFMVIITGSKFAAGPPLSGALMVPAGLRPHCADGEMSEGLADYSTRDDWPEDWTELRAGLRSGANIGQLLRWTAALEEMHAYFAAPELFRKLVLTEFAAVAVRLIGQYENLHPLPVPEWLASDAGDDEFSSQTIFAFKVSTRGRLLTLAESRSLYQALNQDLSQLPSLNRADTRELAAQICQVGQPAAIGDGQGGDTGAIRVSASARLVSQSWSAAGRDGAMAAARAEISRLDTVLAKIALLAAHIDDVRNHLTA